MLDEHVLDASTRRAVAGRGSARGAGESRPVRGLFVIDATSLLLWLAAAARSDHEEDEGGERAHERQEHSARRGPAARADYRMTYFSSSGFPARSMVSTTVLARMSLE